MSSKNANCSNKVRTSIELAHHYKYQNFLSYLISMSVTTSNQLLLCYRNLLLAKFSMMPFKMRCNRF